MSVLFLIFRAVISVVDEVESRDIRIAAVEIPAAHLGSYTLLPKTCCRQVSAVGSHQQVLGSGYLSLGAVLCLQGCSSDTTDPTGQKGAGLPGHI